MDFVGHICCTGVKCVCLLEPEVFISARGHSLHIPYFPASLPLMTHPHCLITESSTHSPSSDYQITLLHTPYNEMGTSLQKVEGLIINCPCLYAQKIFVSVLCQEETTC